VSVRALEEETTAFTKRRNVARLQAGTESSRAWLPLEIYPVSAGVKGGLAGSIAMAVLAVLYGVLSGTSVWYPINLLAAGFIPDAVHTTTTSGMAAFHLRLLLIAIPIHLIASVLVGLLYGAVLPMLPRRPILLGGLSRDVLVRAAAQRAEHHQSAAEQTDRLVLVRAVTDRIRPGRRLVVSRQERIRTWQAAPLAVRMGVSGSFFGNDNGPRQKPKRIPTPLWTRILQKLQRTMAKTEEGSRHSCGGALIVVAMAALVSACTLSARQSPADGDVLDVLYRANCADATERMAREAQRAVWSIRCFSRSPMRPRYGVSRRAAFRGPPCRLSPRQPAALSPMRRSTRSCSE